MYWLTQALNALAGQPGTRLVIKIVLIGALTLLLLRIGYAVYTHWMARRGTPFMPGPHAEEEWWAKAQSLAERGEYTDAAHALYLALIAAFARRGVIAVHHSKTIGDYARELRPRTKPEVRTRFAEFARSYETVVYGLGVCDAPRYAGLMTLAEPLIFSRGRGGAESSPSAVPSVVR